MVISFDMFIILRDHSLSKYTKRPEKLTFLTPDMLTYVCVAGNKKCQLFGKFCEY